MPVLEAALGPASDKVRTRRSSGSLPRVRSDIDCELVGDVIGIAFTRKFSASGERRKRLPSDFPRQGEYNRGSVDSKLRFCASNGGACKYRWSTVNCWWSQGNCYELQLFGRTLREDWEVCQDYSQAAICRAYFARLLPKTRF